MNDMPNIETPICDFINKYCSQEKLRLHMPGHKGKDYIGIEKLDITEIDGADVLYSSNGIIHESEKYASVLFGSSKTVYSTEGSSLCIRAMVYLIKLFAIARGKKPLIAAARNAHKVFMTACVLTDTTIHWVFPEKNTLGIVACKITAEMLEKEFSMMPEKPCAFYLTSPDYLGNMADLKAISEICKRHGVLFVVDNAHGAYLKFLPGQHEHPMDCGVTLCCDSAHKTLPVLTGGAYLHISKDAPTFFSENAEKAMAIFASTSPSYLILQSLDLANRYISDGFSQKLAQSVSVIDSFKADLVSRSFTIVGDEKMKLTVSAKNCGYSGTVISEILGEQGIVCEFADPDYVVMMFSVENLNEAVLRLNKAFSQIMVKRCVRTPPPALNRPLVKLTPRQAMFSESIVLDVEKCIGKVLASANVSCPPAIPIVVCGEVIDKNAIDALKYYGVTKCEVVKE